MNQAQAVAALILAATSISSRVTAQGPRLEPGAPVRVMLCANAQWTGAGRTMRIGVNQGRFVDVSSDSLRFQLQGDGDTVTVALQRVQRVQAVAGIRNRHVVRAALAGLVIGMVVPALGCRGGYGCLLVPITGVGGALIAALAAGSQDRDIWRDVPLDSVRAPAVR